CLLEFDRLQQATIASQSARFGQNIWVDIGRDDRIVATQPIGESTRNGARTTPDLQHCLSAHEIRSGQHLSYEFAVTGLRASLQKRNYPEMRTAEHNHGVVVRQPWQQGLPLRGRRRKRHQHHRRTLSLDTIAYARDLALAAGRNGSRHTALTFDASEEITDGIGDVCCPIGDRIRPCWTRVISELNKFTTSEPTYQAPRTLRRRAMVAGDHEAGRCERIQGIGNAFV